MCSLHRQILRTKTQRRGYHPPAPSPTKKERAKQRKQEKKHRKAVKKARKQSVKQRRGW